jgi:hypothetical protein
LEPALLQIQREAEPGDAAPDYRDVHGSSPAQCAAIVGAVRNEGKQQ